ncbi:MAG: hypothetical protein R3208_21845, partial [Ketobacteraceae bacterium]|nr:hypothetical protein [Ketobacteraceae bacterium]
AGVPGSSAPLAAADWLAGSLLAEVDSGSASCSGASEGPDASGAEERVRSRWAGASWSATSIAGATDVLADASVVPEAWAPTLVTAHRQQAARRQDKLNGPGRSHLMLWIIG